MVKSPRKHNPTMKIFRLTLIWKNCDSVEVDMRNKEVDMKLDGEEGYIPVV